MLHGWGTSSQIWRSWLPLLEAHFCVTCIDLPGLGRSVVNKQRLSLNDVLSTIEPLIPINSLLLGWSLGGLIATLLAERLLSCVKGLVTIGFNPSFVQQKNWLSAMDSAVFERFQKSVAINPQSTLDDFYKLQVLGGTDARPILKALKSIGRDLSPSHLSDALSLLTIDARDVLQQLMVPSLHIYGEKDRLVPIDLVQLMPALSERMSAIKVSNAGHLPFISDAQLVTLELTKFARSI